MLMAASLQYRSFVMLICGVFACVQTARPWRYDLPQEKKNYDNLNVYRLNQTRLGQSPNDAKIIRQSHFAYEYRLGHKLQFLCVATGVPLPRITWLKDGLELSNHKNLMIHEWKIKARKNRDPEDEESKRRVQSKMEIDPTTQGDQGIYTCSAENRSYVDKKNFKAEFTPN